MPYEKIKPYIGEAQIKEKVLELASLINSEYPAELPAFVIAANGGLFFGADLMRAMNRPLTFDTVSISSYDGQESSGRIKIQPGLKIQQIAQGRDLLIVDDILDTGRTLAALKDFLILSYSPASVKSCVLLDKPSRRKVGIKADYAGFTIPDKFVVGYGMDYNEFYRELPYIAVLEE